jgi:uncharacterized protein YceK
MRPIIIAIAATLALAGCATVPMGDATQDTAAKTFSVPAGKSALYIYRNERIGAGVTMDVTLDGRLLGQTAAKTYLHAVVTPGRHVITSKAENTDTLEVVTRPGQATYVWQEVKMGILYARNKLQLVDEATGRQGVAESALAAPPR